MNFQMLKLILEKAEESEIKLPTSAGSSKKQESSRCQSLKTVENSSRDGNTRAPYCLLINLYASQEATVRTRHETTDWFQIGKRICQVYILSPCLFDLYGEYIMRNAGLDKSQAEIKISGRNINDLRYANDTTLTAEREEELKRAS